MVLAIPVGYVACPAPDNAVSRDAVDHWRAAELRALVRPCWPGAMDDVQVVLLVQRQDGVLQ
eukprot:5465938-Lingulodinium_polyedra.AAC.1